MNNFDSTFPIDEYPRIQINKTNECSVCGGDYKYKKSYIHYTGITPKGLYEVRMRTSHPSCDFLMKKLEKSKSEILNYEFELFCKKIQACKLK